jgi:quercetin dioxygenase-like cupin family protein
VKKFNEHDKSFKNGDWGTKYFVNGPHWEGGLAVFKPGQKLGEHYHREIEEMFYFLEGKAQMIVDGKTHQAGAGDVFCVAAGEKHDIINDTEQPVKLLFIKAPYKPDDKITV